MNEVLRFNAKTGKLESFIKPEKGERGDIGPQGPKGDIGPMGQKGPKGDRGEKGEKGDRGPRGEKGKEGPAGPIGPTGFTGPAGANGLIPYSGTGAGKYPMFMPLQGADGGIAQVNNVQLSASYVSGEFSIALCKPLADFPITTLGVPAEREWVAMAPRLYDGANLHLLMYHGVATPVNSAIAGHFDVVWTPA